MHKLYQQPLSLERSAALYRHREAALAAVAIEAPAPVRVAYGLLRFAQQ